MRQCIGRRIQRGNGLKTMSERELLLEWGQTKQQNKRAATVSPAGLKVRKSEGMESDREGQTTEEGKQDFQKG